MSRSGSMIIEPQPQLQMIRLAVEDQVMKRLHGGMGHGIHVECGKWVLKVRCEEWLGLYIFLQHKRSEFLAINQGVTQGCTL